MIDLITIGDVGIDTYYMLDAGDAAIRHCSAEKECELCFDLSEKISVEEIHICAGGNAANAAVGAARLGLKTSILTTVGIDADGKNILHILEREDVDLHNVKQDGFTNQTAALVYKGKRTLLVHHEDREYNLGDPKPARWIYLTSTNIGGYKMNEDIIRWAEANNSKLVYSPGTLQRKAGPSMYKNILEICDLIVMNKEEAVDYTKHNSDDISELLVKLLELGPAKAVITDALEGSYGSDGNNTYFVAASKAKTVDNTGAGDAYSIALTVGLAQGKSLPESMRWGSTNAASVVESVGPQKGLLSLTRLMNRLENCPPTKEIK